MSLTKTNHRHINTTLLSLEMVTNNGPKYQQIEIE